MPRGNPSMRPTMAYLTRFAAVVCLGLLTIPGRSPSARAAAEVATAGAAPTFGALPLRFETPVPNVEGSADAVARGRGGTVLLNDASATLTTGVGDNRRA